MKDYWFKRKRYGWGWVPANAKGLLVVLLFMASLLVNAYLFNEEPLYFGIFLAVAVVVLTIICYKTGEKPKWQWGEKG